MGSATFFLAEYDTDQGLLVAVCDAECLGETYENGEVSLTVEEDFYGGEPADEETARVRLADADVANIVGEMAVELAIEAGYVDSEQVLDVGATRHAQLLRL
jgi:hypothetical protein